RGTAEAHRSCETATRSPTEGPTLWRGLRLPPENTALGRSRQAVVLLCVRLLHFRPFAISAVRVESRAESRSASRVRLRARSIVAQADETGLAEMISQSPCGELDLGHEFG